MLFFVVVANDVVYTLLPTGLVDILVVVSSGVEDDVALLDSVLAIVCISDATVDNNTASCVVLIEVEVVSRPASVEVVVLNVDEVSATPVGEVAMFTSSSLLKLGVELIVANSVVEDDASEFSVV